MQWMISTAKSKQIFRPCENTSVDVFRQNRAIFIIIKSRGGKKKKVSYSEMSAGRVSGGTQTISRTDSQEASDLQVHLFKFLVKIARLSLFRT